MAVSAVLTSSLDKRNTAPNQPVWRARATFTWATGDGHAAQTVTLATLNGHIEAVVVSISNPTGDPTVNVTLTDDLSASIVALTTLAKNTVHYKDEGDIGILPVAGNVVITVDPSADPGGTAQTLTVIVELRGT